MALRPPVRSKVVHPLARNAVQIIETSRNDCAHPVSSPLPLPVMSSVRPETTRAWLIFGVVAACIFVLIGWRKWGELPRNAVTAVVMSADVSTTVTSVLILHVGFHGRLMALYEGNLQRVQFLSKVLRWATVRFL